MGPVALSTAKRKVKGPLRGEKGREEGMHTEDRATIRYSQNWSAKRNGLGERKKNLLK